RVRTRVGSARTSCQSFRRLYTKDRASSDSRAIRAKNLRLSRQHGPGCHGPALAGGSAPALTRDLFTNKFRMEPLSALFIQIRYAMPPKAEANAQLTSEQAADLVAHVLKSNGFPAGKTDFPAADATNSPIGWPASRGVGQAARSHRVGIRQPAISLN